MLRLDAVDAFYGDLQALAGVSLEVREREIVALVGANAAGKSTTLRVISGLVAPRVGRVALGGADLALLPPHRRVEAGIVQVPEGRRLFPFLTVRENLLLGAHPAGARRERERSLAYVHSLFPTLAERRSQLAGSLSGGEQQMCAIARALMSDPKLLLLDEPSLGLAPIVVDQMFEAVRQLHREGMTLLLVEQNLVAALEIATRGYVVETGRVRLEGEAAALRSDPGIRAAYLGI